MQECVINQTVQGRNLPGNVSQINIKRIFSFLKVLNGLTESGVVDRVGTWPRAALALGTEETSFRPASCCSVSSVHCSSTVQRTSCAYCRAFSPPRRSAEQCKARCMCPSPTTSACEASSADSAQATGPPADEDWPAPRAYCRVGRPVRHAACFQCGVSSTCGGQGATAPCGKPARSLAKPWLTSR